MEHWYVLSIVALVFMGMQRFLYKVSAEKKCDTAWTTFSFMATVTVVSTAFFLLSEESVSDVRMLLLIGGINSASFVIGTITHIEALKYVPSSVVYPLVRLNVVIVVLFSILFLDDQVSARQVAGILVAIAVIVILTREAERDKGSRGKVGPGLFLILVCLISGSVAAISSKFAAVYSSKLGFMAVSYSMGTLFSAVLIRKAGKENPGKNRRLSLLVGLVMGLMNFIGFYAFLCALGSGPLSIIASITGMHFVMGVILSAILYKEKPTGKSVLGLCLTMISVLFLRD